MKTTLRTGMLALVLVVTTAFVRVPLQTQWEYPKGSIWDVCAHGDLEAVKKMLAKKPGVVNVGDPNFKAPPLYYAAQSGRFEVVSFLLAYGAKSIKPIKRATLLFLLP